MLKQQKSTKLNLNSKWLKLKHEVKEEEHGMEEEIVPTITGLIGKRQSLCRFTLYV